MQGLGAIVGSFTGVGQGDFALLGGLQALGQSGEGLFSSSAAGLQGFRVLPVVGAEWVG